MTSDLIDELLEAASDKDAQTALTSLWAALDSAGFERSMNTNPSGADGGLTDLHFTLTPPAHMDAATVRRVRGITDLVLYRLRDWEARKATEQRIATFSEACFEGLFVLADGRVADANPYLYTLLGYPPEELLGQDLLGNCFDGRERARIVELLEHGAKGEVVKARRKDGTTFYAELHSKVLVQNHREVHVVAMRDVTEREQTQAVLEERERHLAEWAAAAFSATVVSDGTTILEAGGKTVDLLGYERWELVGRPVLEFVAPPSRRTVERVVADDHFGAYEINLMSKHGDLVPVEVVSALSTWRGHPVRFAGLRDRRELRRLEIERSRLEQRVERGDRLQSWGALAAGISHDFGNLLVGITANAEVLLHLSMTPEASEYAEEIYTAGRRAAELVSELLTFNGNSQPLHKEVIDIGELLVELRRLLSAKLAPNASVVMHVEPHCTLLGNRARLSQVFMNLLTNASDALEGQAGQISVTIDTVHDLDSRWDEAWGARLSSGGYVRIQVQDTGVGMNAELVERAFEPFFTTKHSGNGLGLAACLGTIKAHDGAIHVKSEPGQGTCFSVLIPAWNEPVAPEVRRVSEQVPRAGHVFILDDEPVIRSQLRRSLESRGYRVTDAANVTEAERLLDTVRPDVLLVDMVLGDNDGVDFVSYLRRKGLQAPAILLSGFIDPRLEESLSHDTFQAFVRKPYSVSDLTNTLDSVLECPPLAVSGRARGREKSAGPLRQSRSR